MNSLSYWEKETFFSRIDIAVIGGGIVGLNAAISIKKNAPNLNVAVFEKGALPSGASTKNAGFGCFGSMTELLDDLTERSESEVFGLVEERWKGLHKLRKLLGDDAIEYQHHGGYELFQKKDKASFDKCLSKMDDFNAILKEIIGRKNVFSKADEKVKSFGFHSVSHLIFNNSEGQINTGKMMKALISSARKSGVHIFNGVSVKDLQDDGQKVEIITENGWSFFVKKIIVATNGFSRHLLPELEVRPARNQVVVTSPIAGLHFRGCFHLDRGYFYFRNVDCSDGTGRQRVLLGGGRNLAEQEESTWDFGLTEKIQNSLKNILSEVILPDSNFTIEHQWSGILGIGHAKNPIIKMVSPSVAVAVRLGGMGIAIGAHTGEKAAQLVLRTM